MNKLKKVQILIGFLILFLLSISCTKQYFYSGISESVIQKLTTEYETSNYTKELIIESLGAPLVKENNGDLWIYSSSKLSGNETFRKIVYKKTIKLYFSNNILINIEEL